MSSVKCRGDFKVDLIWFVVLVNEEPLNPEKKTSMLTEFNTITAKCNQI